MKLILTLLFLSSGCTGAMVTTTDLSADGNKHYVSPVWTVDGDIEEGDYPVRLGSAGAYNDGIFTIVHNGAIIYSGTASFSSATALYEVQTTAHIKKGDTLQGLIDSNVPAGSSATSAQVKMIIGSGTRGVWYKYEFYKYYNYNCSATVPMIVELGVFNPGTRIPVSLPLKVSSPGLLRFNVKNDSGVIPLKRGADTILSLDLSSYYDPTRNSISWTAASGSAINGTVIVPQDSAGGQGSVSGSITLNCE